MIDELSKPSHQGLRAQQKSAEIKGDKECRMPVFDIALNQGQKSLC